ncbi:MAG: 4-hydroxybenzoate octaprenyltransferase [Proteobacteria bacterium]|nr:4-hydroxybenzoate octaprenyltransferase [Pseudomonadota bacterium]
MANSKPADALTQHWTDRLPAAWKPFAQLSRLDRPIGWQLLLLPCWMGLAVARTWGGLQPIDLTYAAAFLLGAIAMRGAGCTYNDILDRDIDAKVERTRLRPLVSGAVSLRAAWAWLLVQCLIGLVALSVFPRFAQIVALGALPLVALYPLMKRITWWPQAWLGLVFSWGALVGGAATTAHFWSLPLESLALYVGCIAWTIGYDTIYALQDREDDALIGVRSTARLFGKRWRLFTSLFYVLALSGWMSAAVLAGASWPTFLFIGAVGVLMIRPMIRSIDERNGATALAAFKMNGWIGLAIVAAMALKPLAELLRPELGAHGG